MPLHIAHTTEQLEAARSHDDKILAVRIIRAHFVSHQRFIALGILAAIARLYWQDENAGLVALHSHLSAK